MFYIVLFHQLFSLFHVIATFFKFDNVTYTGRFHCYFYEIKQRYVAYLRPGAYLTFFII